MTCRAMCGSGVVTGMAITILLNKGTPKARILHQIELFVVAVGVVMLAIAAFLKGVVSYRRAKTSILVSVLLYNNLTLNSCQQSGYKKHIIESTLRLFCLPMPIIIKLGF